MGRKKTTLHDSTAEFTVVKQHLIEHSDSADTSVGETQYCQACELPMRSRRDRIQEHLPSGRHYRHRRLFRHHHPRPVLITCTLMRFPNRHTPLLREPPGDVPAPEGQVPPSFSSHFAVFPAFQVERPLAPPMPASQPPLWKAFNTTLGGGMRWFYNVGAGCCGRLGLAVFGVAYGSKALLQSLMAENGCCLLYVVEDQLCDVERAFRAEDLSNTLVVPERDADIVLRDPRVSGVVVCSPPEAASQIVIDSLRAGKGVLCEGLPSLHSQTAEYCFDEADKRGRPLVCGFYKRFDPAVQFLIKKVCDDHAVGQLRVVSVISTVYPAASPHLLKKSGGIFYTTVVHDVDVVTTLLGECIPNMVIALGNAFCPDVASLKDADTAVITMKFPSKALGILDVSQHCTHTCNQQVQVYGSEGNLKLSNQQAQSIHSPDLILEPQTQAERYGEAYRQLLKHFLRTLQGKEAPAVSREQLLRALRVAAAAEQSWLSRQSIDPHRGVGVAPVVKMEEEDEDDDDGAA